MYKTKWANERVQMQIKDEIERNPFIVPLPLFEIIDNHMANHINNIQVILLLTILLIEMKGEIVNLQSISHYLDDYLEDKEFDIEPEDMITEIQIKNEIKNLMKLGFIIRG